MPAGTPPPGVIPNLTDPPNLEAVTIAIGVLMIVLTALVVSARLYTNVFVIRSMGWEDCQSAAILSESILTICRFLYLRCGKYLLVNVKKHLLTPVLRFRSIHILVSSSTVRPNSFNLTQLL